MPIKDALQIIINKLPGMSVIECLEFPEFYAFALAEKGKEKEDFGGGYHTINKRDGSLSTFIPTMDFQLFQSAIPIDLKELLQNTK